MVGFTARATSQKMPPGHFEGLKADVARGAVVKC